MTEQIFHAYGPVGSEPRILMDGILSQIGFTEVTVEFNEKYGTSYGWVYEYQDEDIAPEGGLYFLTYRATNRTRLVFLRYQDYNYPNRDVYSSAEHIHNGDAGSSSSSGHPAYASCRIIKGDNFLIIMPLTTDGYLSAFMIGRTSDGKNFVANPGGHANQAAPSSYYTCVTYIDPLTKAYMETTGTVHTSSSSALFLINLQSIVNSNTEQMATIAPLYMSGGKLPNGKTVDPVDNLYVYQLSLKTGFVNSGTKFRVGDDYYLGITGALCLKLDGESLDTEGPYVSDYDYAGLIRKQDSVYDIPMDTRYIMLDFWTTQSVPLLYESPEESVKTGQYSAYSVSKATVLFYYDLVRRNGPGEATYTHTAALTSATVLHYTISSRVSVDKVDDESYKVTLLWTRLEVLDDYNYTVTSSGTTYNRVIKKQIVDMTPSMNTAVWYINGFGEGPGIDTSNYVEGGASLRPDQNKLSKSTHINLTVKIPRPLNRGTVSLEGSLGKEELRTIVATSDKLYTMVKTVNDAEYKAVFKITASNNQTLAGLAIQFQSATRGGGNVTSESKFLVEYVTPSNTDTSGSGSGSGGSSEEDETDTTYGASSAGTPAASNWTLEATKTGSATVKDPSELPDEWDTYRIVVLFDEVEVSLDLTETEFDKIRPKQIEESRVQFVGNTSEVYADDSSDYTIKRAVKKTVDDETYYITVSFTISYRTGTDKVDDDGNVYYSENQYAQWLSGISLKEARIDELNKIKGIQWHVWRHSLN